MDVLDVNPLVASWVGELRDPNCGVRRFRELLGRISTQLGVAAASHLCFDTVELTTPLGEPAQVQRLAADPVIVPVLRAGLSMCDALLGVFEGASVALVGAARDETTLTASFYLPCGPQVAGLVPVVCDPMLATGSSVVATLDHLAELGAEPGVVCAVLAAPEGVAHVQASHPGWQLCVATVDDALDGRGYIVPGLGDAGDRWAGLERPW